MARELPRHQQGRAEDFRTFPPIKERGSEPHPEVPRLILRSRYLYFAVFNGPLIAALILFFQNLGSNLLERFNTPSLGQALGSAFDHPTIWALLLLEIISGFFWLVIATEFQRVRGSKLAAIFTRRIFDQDYKAKLNQEWVRYQEGRSPYGPLIGEELQTHREKYRFTRGIFADLILKPALIRPLSSITEEELHQDAGLFANFLDYHLTKFNLHLLQPNQPGEEKNY
jgi:hypothetical protein